ncbi:MAG: hypothetical protein U0174_06335 [Polyangiaceae bacterium]
MRALSAIYALSLCHLACQVDPSKTRVAPTASTKEGLAPTTPPHGGDVAVGTTTATPVGQVATIASTAAAPPVPPPKTWSADPEANRITLTLFERFGVRSDTEREHMMDGGFRGKIHIVPAEPIGPERHHLEWIKSSYEKTDAWMKQMASLSPKHRYRTTPIALKFFISENRTTPSAYAIDWSIAYNFRGSLLQTEAGVHETFVHETFHLNDQAHDDWSSRTMSELYRRIRTRCGTKSTCYAPYSPGTTMVRGGTYYAFHADNDVREYAAELMVRFYKEADAIFRGAPLPRTAKFKCGPEENKLAWEGFVNEFWDGKDPIPGC